MEDAAAAAYKLTTVQRFERDERCALLEERVETLLQEIQQQDNHEQGTATANIDTTKHNHNLTTTAVEIMLEFAQLGKAGHAERLYHSLVQQQPPQQVAPSSVERTSNANLTNHTATSTTTTPVVVLVTPKMQWAMLRCLLHAWSNRLRLVPRKSSLATEAAERAASILQTMMMETTTSSSSRTTRMMAEHGTIMDASDFATVIKNYLFLVPPDVVAVLKIWNVWNGMASSSSTNSNSSIDAPSILLSARIIRCIANLGEGNDWTARLENANKAAAVVQAALETTTAAANQLQQQQPPRDDNVLKLYNSLLEVWSKLLPPPSKQNTRFGRNTTHEEREFVGARTRDTIQDMMARGLWRPNSQTYATVMYAYCKCGWLDPAWDVWNEWKQQLFSATTSRDSQQAPIDVRSLRMLIQSSVRYSTQVQNHLDANEQAATIISSSPPSMEYADLVKGALDDMWALYDIGYRDMKPDIILYTSLLNCWSNPQFNISIQQTTSLIDNLNERYQQLKWSSLQPDMPFYTAWINLVRKRFDNNNNDDAIIDEATMSAAELAGSILNQMEHQSLDNPSVAPDTHIYNFLIDACLSDATAVGVERAEQTLNKMIEISTSTGSSRQIAPNGRSFAAVARAWVQLDTARAEYWLDRMEERFIPSSSIFKEVILQCCDNTLDQKEDGERRRQAERARRLLKRMEELSKVTENPYLQPDRQLYDRVMEAWERCDGDGQSKAAKIAKLQESQKELYLAKRSDDESGNQIKSDEQIFQLMKELGISFPGGKAPEANTRNFNQLLRELAKSGKPSAGQLAESIFVYMLNQYSKNANVKVQPNIITFNR